MNFVKTFLLLGADIVTICDFNKTRLDEAVKKISSDTAVYDNFESFIEHDMDAVVLANYFPEHWRNFLPRSYYITHSLGPIMRATGATPRRVTFFASFAPIEGDATASYNGDRVAIITTQNDDGSIFRITVVHLLADITMHIEYAEPKDRLKICAVWVQK